MTGAVSVLKRDEAGGVLSGARFELWRETNGRDGAQFTGPGADTRFAECTTDGNGLCERGGLEPALYYWRETAAPDGYALPAYPVTAFDADAGDAATGVAVTVADDPRDEEYEGSLHLLKRDAKTGRPLRGAVFEVWKEANATAGPRRLGRLREPVRTRRGPPLGPSRRGRRRLRVGHQTRHRRLTVPPLPCPLTGPALGTEQ